MSDPYIKQLESVLAGALGDIFLERERQVNEEGFTPEQDDRYVLGELGAAAACYAVCARDRQRAFNSLWPSTWGREWFKPMTRATDNDAARRRDLVKAAALIVAEIERLDRRVILGREGKL